MRQAGWIGVGVGLLVLAGAWLRGQGPATPARVSEPTSYRDVVRQVLPAVVSLECKGVMPREDGGIAGFGSGFVIDPKGSIATCGHVVTGAEVVEVVLADGRRFTAKEVRLDAKTDLALVRIEPGQALPFLAWGDSDRMEIGDRVLAVGAPFRLAGSVTHGIISGKGRSPRVAFYEDFLQTDAAINPGNSGGPLVDLDGRVIGINSTIQSKTASFQGIGLAVSANLARDVLGQLQVHGVVRRGYLGLQVSDLESPEAAARLGLKSIQGVVITHVHDNGPAKKAGLASGDLLVALDGKPIREGKDFKDATARLPVGKVVDVTLVRDGQPRSARVTIEEQPREFGVTPATPRSGLQVERLGLELADSPVNTVRGALVLRVQPGSLALAAGLRPGLTIMRVDNQVVDSAAAAREALTRGSLERGISVQVFSQTMGTGYVLVRSGG
jgi:serine protease Do